MKQLKRQLQRLDRAFAKATSPDPYEELRIAREKLRHLSPEELAQRYRALLNEPGSMGQRDRYKDMSCDDLLREFRRLIERSHV